MRINMCDGRSSRSIFVCYGPSEYDNKEQKVFFWGRFQDEIERVTNKILIIGDRNCKVTRSEIEGRKKWRGYQNY